MRRLLAAAVISLRLHTADLAANPRDCFNLSAVQDNDVSSPSGIRVTITGRNNCNDSVDSRRVWFKVKAVGIGNAVVASQRGHFGPVIPPQGVVETKVFVVCDPEKVRSVTVDAE